MAITLKDLMDPLTKIAAATEKTAQKIDAVVAAVTGGPGASLNQEIIKELKTQTNLLRTIAGNTKGGSGIKVDGKPVNQDKLKEGAAAIKMLGGGASSLAFGLLTFMLVPKGVVKKFTTTIKELMDAFAKINPKKVKAGSKAFELIAKSVGQFAKGLALAGILFIPAMIGVGLIMIATKILLPTFELLGDSEKRAKQGAKTLLLIGSALDKFAKGLVLAAIGATIGILFTPVIVLTMILLSGAFARIGKMGKHVRDGGRAIDRIGKGLIFFSIGLVTFALATMFILAKPVILLAMVGTLVLIGGAFALLGVFDKSIKKGAIALFVVGLSLIAFSIGYLIFAATTQDMTLERVGIQAAVLLGIGLVTALLGKRFISVIKGAIAIAGMGLGLLVFGLGYLPFAFVTKNMTMESIGVQLALLLGLGLEFAAAGLGEPFILAGAVAFAAVGAALLLLAPGLSAIKAVDFNENDSTKLAIMLSGVKSGFLGGSTSDEGFFAKVGGALTGAVDSVRMIEAAAGFTAAGLALLALSKGLTAFKEVNFKEEDSVKLVVALNGVTTAFALAGSGEQVPSSSLFGEMFGFKRTAVEEGIGSVLGAGRALKDVASGLQSFQALINSGVNFGQPDSNGRYEKGTLGYAVVNTIGFINEAFAAVGEQGNADAGGFFGSLFGIKQNKVAEGIDSVKGAGAALTGIAEGLIKFQTLVDKKISWEDLGKAISDSVGFVRTAFATVAGEGNVESGGFFGSLLGIKQNKVAEGINAVKGAGAELTNIANGLTTFASLENPAAIADSIKTLFTSIGDTFTFYYNKPKFQGQLDHMKGFITEISENAKQGLIHKAADGIKEIAKAVNSIDSVKAEAFANLFKGAGDLTNNKDAFDSLLEAVNDIREALSKGNIGNTVNPLGSASTSPVIPSKNDILAPILNDINISLSRLNGTMTSLPAQIQSIRIIIPE